MARTRQMDADVALLQEARMRPEDVVRKVELGAAEHWDSHYWKCGWRESLFGNLVDRREMDVKLSDRVEVDCFTQVSPIRDAGR